MIVDLKPGDKVISYFVLRKKEMRTKRESGELYLSVELVDASGRISGSYWDNVKKKYDALDHGDVLKVKATVIDFKNRKHLSIEKLRKALDRDDYDLSQLVPKVDKDIEQLLEKLNKLIIGVQDPHLDQLLKSVFDDPEVRKEFAQAPGGKLWHHNYIGGLLEHTLSVTEIAQTTGAMYPGVDLDLLIAAGLLHDIGKIASYSYDTLIDFTDEGRLIGHIVIGSQMVAQRIQEIKGFPKELQKRLIHLILSHQGKLEQASPVVPMTLEGLILYYADELDSKANAFLRIKKKEGHRRWSSYVNLMGQYFYFGSQEEE